MAIELPDRFFERTPASLRVRRLLSLSDLSKADAGFVKDDFLRAQRLTNTWNEIKWARLLLPSLVVFEAHGRHKWRRLPAESPDYNSKHPDKQIFSAPPTMRRSTRGGEAVAAQNPAAKDALRNTGIEATTTVAVNTPSKRRRNESGAGARDAVAVEELLITPPRKRPHGEACPVDTRGRPSIKELEASLKAKVDEYVGVYGDNEEVRHVAWRAWLDAGAGCAPKRTRDEGAGCAPKRTRDDVNGDAVADEPLGSQGGKRRRS